MGKAVRKPRPSPPHWYWFDVDGCWDCRNRNGCGGCKRLKRQAAMEREKRNRAGRVSKLLCDE
ncbi:hypothetical protein DW085_01885 [Clostridium sp. AF50-3]|nr:hypothetical protein DW085_01885 [Clostridium sp. AF50-3]